MDIETWTSQQLQIRGARQHFTRTGGHKPALLLVHGAADNGLCWSRAAQRLQAHYDLLMPDLAGHGLSELGLTLDYPGDLATLIEALELRDVMVCGHSLGASSAACLASDYPHLISRLVLVDPPWRLPGEIPSPPVAARPGPSWILMLHPLPLAAIKAEGGRRNPSWPEADLRQWALAKQQFDPRLFELETNYPHWQETLARIHCPTFLMSANPGLGGRITPDAIAAASKACPTLQSLNFLSAGHYIHFDQLEEFSSALNRFLSA